jgi:hypothetical protein
VTSRQGLSEADRRAVAPWAADCAEHVLDLFEAVAPDDRRPREAIVRTRAFGRGELDVATEIRTRFEGGGAFQAVADPAASAAARAAGQAAAVAHMGAHALGAAGYAAKAAALAGHDGEVAWQLARLDPAARAILATLPPLGADRAGPLGPGLLARGAVGDAIRALQAALH